MREKLKRIFCLSGKRTLLIAIPVFLLTGIVLAYALDGMFVYMVYFASAYALIIAVTLFVRTVPRIRAWFYGLQIWNLLRKFRLGRLLLGEVVFRTKVSLYFGMAANLFYVVIKFVNHFGGHAVFHS